MFKALLSFFILISSLEVFAQSTRAFAAGSQVTNLNLSNYNWEASRILPRANSDLKTQKAFENIQHFSLFYDDFTFVFKPKDIQNCYRNDNNFCLVADETSQDIKLLVFNSIYNADYEHKLVDIVSLNCKVKDEGIYFLQNTKVELQLTQNNILECTAENNRGSIRLRMVK